VRRTRECQLRPNCGRSREGDFSREQGIAFETKNADAVVGNRATMKFSLFETLATLLATIALIARCIAAVGFLGDTELRSV
jgi:hypothetical protein